MKYLKKTFALLLMLLIVLSLGVMHAAAHSSVVAGGGWDEETGYYINSSEQSFDAYELLASVRYTDKPDSHEGKKLTYAGPSGDPGFSAWGHTVWAGKYHYTTAQMEDGDGGVLTTSDRQWGYYETEATSPYYWPALFETVKARSYWGYNT